MSLDLDAVVKAMASAASASLAGDWATIKGYAPTEFRKIAIQLADIAANVALYDHDPHDGFSPEVGKVLLEMQIHSAESVLVAVTALTITAVRKALKAALDTAVSMIGGALLAVV